MKLKVVLVDDEKENTELLSYFIEKFCKDVEVVGVAKNIPMALEIIENENPHLIFLDIELSNGETGFDLLNTIKGWGIQVVFVTAYSQYAYDAIKNGVIDYILKPISIVDLQQSIETVKDRIGMNKSSNDELVNNQLNYVQTNDTDVIAIPHQNEIELIKKNEIVFLKADGKYTIFNLTNDRNVISSRNIREYEIMLTTNSFIRVHHSYIINVNQLKKIEKTIGWFCVMSDSTKVPVSRRKKDELYQKLNL